ncbi:hypothetical protein WGP40_03440 [Brachymonas sp. G13]|uniref:hypothetical protein n=1 Tax=Brachymonas TaxID=28219 RepID=UPI0016BC30BC|nr:hypothetical protein [Brachymonas sp. J145]MEE1653464.1 hypothetical protein [Brachymonas sp. J145]NLX17635.1 hypothetical protein [Ramlibacter sp.]
MIGQTEMLLGAALALTVFACWQILSGVLGLKKHGPEYARAVGRRLVLTTIAFIAIPLLIWLGQDQWGERTGLYAFLAGLVTVNAIWFRKLR